MFVFLRDNSRWLLGGVLLTFFSSFGQTFFIALFSPEIRQTFELSHGDFGTLYMTGTLASAATLLWLGRIVDHNSVVRVALAVILSLALACGLMATVNSVVMLVVTLYLLRLFGQGMMTHIAMTAMGRWYGRERGRAVSLTTMGHQLGEGLFPLLVVALVALVGWRYTWVLAVAALLLIAAPAVAGLLRVERVPASDPADHPGAALRHWTRSEVLQDPPFWILCLAVLAPAFIGTSFLFHQVHIAEVKLWSRTLIAGAFVVLSSTTIVCTLITGALVDRYSARTLLPLFLIPMGLGCLLLGWLRDPSAIFIFMLLLGMSYGMASTLFGALWPELYGTRHLGAIRSVTMAAMVLASAAGPGLTGRLLDRGLGIETQLQIMGIYCLITALIMWPLSRHLQRRSLLQQQSDVKTMRISDTHE